MGPQRHSLYKGGGKKQPAMPFLQVACNFNTWGGNKGQSNPNHFWEEVNFYLLKGEVSDKNALFLCDP